MNTIVLSLLLLSWNTFAQEVPMRIGNFLPVNVHLEETVYHSRKALRMTETGKNSESIAVVKDIRFSNGTIEMEVAGAVLPTADSTARGFIGIAFRVSTRDTIRYDCMYLRPGNGRSGDQVRRNHTTQYIAHPKYPWFRLRKEFPSTFESYADIGEGEWTKIRITVEGKRAALFINDAQQPALIVNDLLNTASSGGIALWIGQGTDGYFRNLTVTPK